MASETLQTAIQYTYYLCELYEKNGERILGNQQPLAEFAGFSYYKYLLYLANLDRRLEETEVQYLNDLLHYNMTLSQLQTFCKRHPFTAESVQDTLRGLLDLWIRVDLAEQGNSSLSLFFLNLLNLMGLSFTADTNQRDERQARLGEHCKRKAFCNSEWLETSNASCSRRAGSSIGRIHPRST